VSEYGEPLTSTTLLSGVLNLSSSEFLERAVSCVNACAGFDPPEMRRLAVAMKICLGSLCVQYDPRKSQGLYLSGPHGGLPDLQLKQFTVEEILRAARELKLPEIEMLEAK
jgi:hypothetical protein